MTKYFRHIPSGSVYPENGVSIATRQARPQDWEEVIVTAKPQPKVWKRRVALFVSKGMYKAVIHNGNGTGSLIYEDDERISDWIEVPFYEKQG
jgi:hypothetical protein